MTRLIWLLKFTIIAFNVFIKFGFENDFNSILFMKLIIEIVQYIWIDKKLKTCYCRVAKIQKLKIVLSDVLRIFMSFKETMR